MTFHVDCRITKRDPALLQSASRGRAAALLRGALVAALAGLLLTGIRPALADQIGANPNPTGTTIHVTGSDYNDVNFTNNGTIQVDSSGTLKNTDLLKSYGILSNAGTLNNLFDIKNFGSLTNQVGGTLTNTTSFGSIVNNTGATFTNYGAVNNTNSARIVNDGAMVNVGTISNDKYIYNTGTMTNSGSIFNLSNGEISNTGTFYNTGNITNQDFITNSKTWYNSGTLTSSGWIANATAATLTNTGTITNTNVVYNYLGGTWTNAAGASLNNSSAFYNWGRLDNAGTLTNTGTFSSNGTLTNTGTLVNNGVIQGTGTFTQSGAGATTTNAGTFQLASVTISGGVFLQNSGSLSADSLSIDSGGTLRVSGGTVSVTSGVLTDNGLLQASPPAGTTVVFPFSIAGSGLLVKSDAGTLVLSGTNTYTGATTVTGGTLSISSAANLQGTSGVTLDGGTLRSTGTFTLAKPISLGAAGGTFSTDSGTTLTLSGAVTDAAGVSGSLTKTGAGTLVLTNSGNTYSGPTFVNQGTLRAGAANTFSPNSAVNVASGATLDCKSFDQAVAGLSGAGAVSLGAAALTVNTAPGQAYTFDGVISGTGGRLVKSGAGALNLTGVNTFTVGVTLAGGVLGVASDASLGAPSGPLTFNGGTLQANGPLATSRTFTVEAGGGGVNNNGNPATLAGEFTGSGPFAFGGAGKTTFSGDGSGYTGQSTLTGGFLQVSATGSLGGTLTVNQGAALGGYGSVGNLINNGLLAPGGSIGTLSVSGDYVQGASSAYLCEVTPASADSLAVSGSARIEGGLLYVQAAQTFYNTATRWPLITTGSGVTGSFSEVRQNLVSPTLFFLPETIGQALYLTTWRLPYSTYAANVASQGVGVALYRASYTAAPTSEMASLLSMLDYSPPAVTSYTLGVLSPEPYDAFTQAAFDAGRLLTAAQCGGLHDGTSGNPAFAGPLDAGPDSIMAFNEWANGRSAFAQAASPASGGAQGPLQETSRLGVFLRPFGMLARQDADSRRTGYNATTWGLTGGLVYRPVQGLTLGLAPGFYGQNLRLKTVGGGTGTINDWSLALMAAYRHEGWFAEGLVRAGYETFVATRALAVPGFGRTAKAAWDGWNTTLALSGGYDFTVGGFTLGPAASVEWQQLSQGAFHETRAGALGQSLKARTDASLNTTLGARVSRTFETSWGSVTPEARAAWGAQWQDDPRRISASFLGASGSTGDTATARHGYNSALLDAGVSLRVRDSLSATLRGGVELFRPGYQSEAVGVGIKYSF